MTDLILLHIGKTLVNILHGISLRLLKRYFKKTFIVLVDTYFTKTYLQGFRIDSSSVIPNIIPETPHEKTGT